MPRRKFTARDLAPLRRVTQRILAKEPDAALVASAAGPFKRRMPRPTLEERTEVRLPVEVETSRNLDGVPLHEIAKEARKEFPGVSGISVTPGGVSLKFDRAPTAAQRRKIESLLTDKSRLEALRPPIREVPRPSEAEPRRLPEADLRRVLHAPETSDAAWLRAFRTFAVEHLVEQPEPPAPDRPSDT